MLVRAVCMCYVQVCFEHDTMQKELVPSNQPLLLLATLDGPVEAVNKLTGKTVWTLDGGMEHSWHDGVL